MTLDEWSESTEAHKFLVENLKANMDAYGIDEGYQDDLLRVNLIMIRQFEEQINERRK